MIGDLFLEIKPSAIEIAATQTMSAFVEIKPSAIEITATQTMSAFADLYGMWVGKIRPQNLQPASAGFVCVDAVSTAFNLM
uniref:Uncharacterized protein n=3 Tax=Planktothrix agardhii TaxID=1160 RepID=A0A1J1JAB1_PLAAG|nr:protein of unknown function [Planktothrix agardhii]